MIKYKSKIKPFLKWAGGKTQLLNELSNYIPKEFGTYFEPFVGGGALYFQLQPQNAVISDTNEELINAYEQLKSNPKEVIFELSKLKNTEEDYYRIRKLNPVNLPNTQRASRMIYLNKTCFNGLYRVNKKGEFNVPYGSRKTVELVDENLIYNISNTLKKTRIICADYQKVLKDVKKNDFVFLDPPYFPTGKYSDFKRYTKEGFHIKEHEQLKECFDRLIKLGAHVIQTNSNAPFIKSLYKNYKINIIKTKRFISSNSKTRTGEDIIITSF